MRRSRGFTLLELLIGMSLLGLMLVLLFAGFRLASDSWDAVDGRLARTTDDEMARALLRRAISQLQPSRWKPAMNQPLAFVGEPNRLLALAPLSGQAGFGGLRVIEFAVDHASDGEKDSLNMVLRQAPIRYDVLNFSDALAGARSHKILGNVANVQFAYFGAPKKGEPAQWFDAWPNPEDLPRLIRIRLNSRADGWSEILVAPMVAGTGCRWNSFYKKCMPLPT